MNPDFILGSSKYLKTNTLFPSLPCCWRRSRAVSGNCWGEPLRKLLKLTQPGEHSLSSSLFKFGLVHGCDGWSSSNYPGTKSNFEEETTLIWWSRMITQKLPFACSLLPSSDSSRWRKIKLYLFETMYLGFLPQAAKSQPDTILPTEMNIWYTQDVVTNYRWWLKGLW